MARDLSDWSGCAEPRPAQLEGKHVRLDAYQSSDAEALWAAFGGTAFNELARYFPNPAYVDVTGFAAWLDGIQGPCHTMVYRDRSTGQVVGMASYMRMDAANGAVEIGSICVAPNVQRTRLATEAQFLLMRHVFDDLGYRRYEWKLNNENAPSHRAAVRFGFRFEGVFRNHMVAKGKNRDTAWYAMTDDDWPQVKRAFLVWLSADNFDETGAQRISLTALNASETPFEGKTFWRASLRDKAAIAAFQTAAYARTGDVIGDTPLSTAWDYDDLFRTSEIWVIGDIDDPDAVLILQSNGHLLDLESIATHQRCAGQSLGRLMMRFAEHRARAFGHDGIWLCTDSRNPAVAWYTRLGFKITKEEPLETRTILHFEKALGED